RRGVDLMIDAIGFQYSDQWNHSLEHLKTRASYYKGLKKAGTKIVLLPQAFGPFETDNGKKSVTIINQYCDLIYAREKQSYQYLVEAGANPDKVLKSCDFTFKVKGTVPDRYYHLKGKICIIPNQKMVT